MELNKTIIGTENKDSTMDSNRQKKRIRKLEYRSFEIIES